MQQPTWDDPDLSAGAMVRGGLWLLQVVGEGNTFTKNELRDAFPGISQVDRRIRDLRDYGWVVYSSTEDATLMAEDQRFVKAGVAVWDPKARRAAAPHKAIPSKERQGALVRDGYMCTLCGIAGGEPYPDDAVMTAVLSVFRRAVTGTDGRETEVLVTECKRCNAGRGDPHVDARDVLTAARQLGSGELRRLLRWVERGRRGSTELDRAWGAYLRVPSEQRREVADRLRGMG